MAKNTEAVGTPDGIIVGLSVTQQERDRMPKIEVTLTELGVEALETGNLDGLKDLAEALLIVRHLRVLYDSVKAHPTAEPAKPAKGRPAARKPQGMKIKHVYDPASGLCTVDHDGAGVCGKLRERAPRSGSEAAAPTEDTRTGVFPTVAEMEGGAK